ncbi:MAG: V-type ATP synthase subunit F [Lachnospiraceae bacterium]|jgi:V/A-type H+-transporting ATPase subunit F|nr:V-type ATP synthase subunit F [Lachnospiraceae bacterium]
MFKIAVLGDYDSIYGFATLGLDTFPVQDQMEASRKLEALSDSDYGIIYITEAMAALLKTQIAQYAGRITPAIIQIPGISGNTGAAVEGVKKSVEQAVGSDILFSNH